MTVENNIILLATYWNERQWIKPSLKQICRIDPIEVIICDGCFDPNRQNRSTDGTREEIADFVADRDNAIMVSAQRPWGPRGVLSMFRGHDHSSLRNMFTIPRINTLYKSARTASYRLNQALTFKHMISQSKRWEPGRWFMTYDADQFYSDETIDKFSLTAEETDYGILTAEERTFFTSFDRYTTDYERRTYNNMPHKIYRDSMIQPTRDLVLEGPTRTDQSLDSRWYEQWYIHHVRTKMIGTYNHYKIESLDPSRFEEGYELGDRERPDGEQYKMQDYNQGHPEIISEHFPDKV
jgi:cation diffusion facilitator CzcD-associated flavoprotein CzcO